jgi:hypothetical protein
MEHKLQENMKSVELGSAKIPSLGVEGRSFFHLIDCATFGSFVQFRVVAGILLVIHSSQALSVLNKL